MTNRLFILLAKWNFKEEIHYTPEFQVQGQPQIVIWLQMETE